MEQDTTPKPLPGAKYRGAVVEVSTADHCTSTFKSPCEQPVRMGQLIMARVYRISSFLPLFAFLTMLHYG